MKTRIAFFLVMMTIACPVAFGQLRLTAGDRCTCPFGWTNFILFPTGPGPFQPVFGEVLVRLYETSLPPGTVLRFEMFENSATGPALCSGFITDTNPNPSVAACDVNYAWGDLQGTVRLTMVSGSVTLHSVSLQVGRFENDQYQRWMGGLPMSSITADPRLHITRVSKELVEIAWPTNSVGYVLEQTSTLPGAAWSPVTNGVSNVGGQSSVVVGNGQAQSVFRLRKLQ